MSSYIPGYAQSPLQTANAKARILTEGYRAVWFMVQKRAKPMWKEFFEKRTSSKRSEVEFSMIPLGLAQPSAGIQETPFEAIGDGDSKETQWIVFKKGYMASREGVADDQYGVHRKSAKKLPESFIYAIERNCAGTLGGVFTTTLGFDPVTTAGVPICSTSHNFASGKSNLRNGAGTWSNRLGDSALSWETLKAGHILMQQTPDDGGYPMELMADCLVVSVENSDIAYELTKTDQRPDSNENTKNILANAWKTETKVWRWLTDDAPYYLIDKNEFNGFYVDRDEAEFHEDMDWNKGIYRWFGYQRGNSDINEPRGIVGSAGA